MIENGLDNKVLRNITDQNIDNIVYDQVKHTLDMSLSIHQEVASKIK